VRAHECTAHLHCAGLGDPWSCHRCAGPPWKHHGSNTFARAMRSRLHVWSRRAHLPWECSTNPRPPRLAHRSCPSSLRNQSTSFCEEASQVSHHQATNGDHANIAYDQGGCVRVKGGVRKAEGSAGRKPACAGLRTTACAVPVVSLSVS